MLQEENMTAYSNSLLYFSCELLYLISRDVTIFIVVARLSRAVGMTMWGLCRANKQSRPEFNRLT